MSNHGDPASHFKLLNPIEMKLGDKTIGVTKKKVKGIPPEPPVPFDLRKVKVWSIAKFCNERDCFNVGMSCDTDAECGTAEQGEFRCIYGSCYYCP